MSHQGASSRHPEIEPTLIIDSPQDAAEHPSPSVLHTTNQEPIQQADNDQTDDNEPIQQAGGDNIPAVPPEEKVLLMPNAGIIIQLLI